MGNSVIWYIDTKSLKIQYCHKAVLHVDVQHYSDWLHTPRGIKEMATTV